MATGDPIAVEVLANGWEVDVDFEGLSGIVGTEVVADFDAGFASTDVPTTDAANFYFTVTSEGYDETGTLGTIERTVYVTRAQRKPYPDEADLEASVPDATSNARVRFVLSGYIHNDDTATVVIKSGLNDNTNAGTPTVTNSSTVDYPPVTRFKFATEPGQRLSGTFEPAVSVGHAYAQQGRAVAAVEFTLTDSSANSVSQVVTASEADQSARDPDLPLRVEVFRASLDTSGLDDDEAATLRVRVFPWVGDADSVLDTNGGTFPDERANQPHHIGGTVYYAYAEVGASGGTVSTTAATAQADPYPSIWDARNALNSAAGSLNNCVIRCIGTGHAWGRDSFAGVAAAASAFLIIETDPDEASNATITTLEATSNEVRCARVWLRDINIAPAGSVSNFFASVGSSDLYQFSRCVVTHSGSGTVFKASAVEYFRAYDCLLVNMIASFTTDAYMTEWQNCEHSININAANIHGGWFDESSNFNGSSVFSTSSAATFCLTNIRMQNDAAAIVSLGHAVTNSYIGHSVLKRYSNGTQPGIDANNIDIDTLVIEQVTVAGCRVNPQNDSAPDNSQTGIYVNGLASPYTAPKHDTFGNDGTLIGGWAFFFGANLRNSYNGDAGTFPFAYPGTNVVSRISATDPEREADLYTDNQSTYGSDSSTFGDYTPLQAGDLFAMIPAGQAPCAFDIYGRSVLNNGQASAGAVQRTTSFQPQAPQMVRSSTFNRATRLQWGW